MSFEYLQAGTIESTDLTVSGIPTNSTVVNLISTSLTLTPAQVIGGIITSSTASLSWQVPTGASISAALPESKVGTTFTTLLFNSNASPTVTITTNTGITLFSTASSTTARGFLIFRCTDVNTWTCYFV